jgi:thymidylate synthase
MPESGIFVQSRGHLDTVLIVARDLNEAWHLAIQGVFEHGRTYTIDRGSYQGQKRLEFDYVTLHILNPGTLPLVPDTPPGVPPPTSMEYVEEYLPYLMTDAPKENEQYTYGYYLQPQIQKVINMYKEDGYGTNQAYMAVGDMASIDLEHPPCLRGIDTRISNNRLHFIVYFRSWDLIAGFPSNLAAIQLLKEYMASSIGVEDGEIIASSKGLHIYDHFWDMAKLCIGK